MPKNIVMKKSNFVSSLQTTDESFDQIIATSKEKISSYRTNVNRAQQFGIIVQKLLNIISMAINEQDRSMLHERLGIMPYDKRMILININKLCSLTTSKAATKTYLTLIGCIPIKEKVTNQSTWLQTMNQSERRKWRLYSIGQLSFPDNEAGNLSEVLARTAPKIGISYSQRTHA